MTERNLTTKVAQYLQMAYPKVIYRFDLAADQRLSIQQATRNSKLHGRWSRGFVDLTIFHKSGDYGALFIELKVDTVYKKDGELKKSEHLRRQAEFHMMLRERGYKAEFGCGFDEIKALIDNYIKI